MLVNFLLLWTEQPWQSFPTSMFPEPSMCSVLTLCAYFMLSRDYLNFPRPSKLIFRSWSVVFPVGHALIEVPFPHALTVQYSPGPLFALCTHLAFPATAQETCSDRQVKWTRYLSCSCRGRLKSPGTDFVLSFCLHTGGEGGIQFIKRFM